MYKHILMLTCSVLLVGQQITAAVVITENGDKQAGGKDKESQEFVNTLLAGLQQKAERTTLPTELFKPITTSTEQPRTLKTNPNFRPAGPVYTPIDRNQNSGVDNNYYSQVQPVLNNNHLSPNVHRTYTIPSSVPADSRFLNTFAQRVPSNSVSYNDGPNSYVRTYTVSQPVHFGSSGAHPYAGENTFGFNGPTTQYRWSSNDGGAPGGYYQSYYNTYSYDSALGPPVTTHYSYDSRRDGPPHWYTD